MTADAEGTRPRLQVLVVEDEFLIAMDLQCLLQENGFDVLGPAGTIEKALKLLDTAHPDIGILDYNIARQPVTPVATRLNDLGIPFILSSADETARRDKAFENAGVVRKPIDAKELVEALIAAADVAA